MLYDPARRGKKLDLVLLEEWRSLPDGTRKRGILNQLVWENEPLVKVIVDQLCGRGTTKRKLSKMPGNGAVDFAKIPWDDAYQAGLIALVKALTSYDPSKGGIAGHLRWSCLYQLQCICQRDGLTRAPRGCEHEAPSVDLVGEQRELDECSSGHESAGLLTAEGFTPQDVQRWQDTGEWPESIEDAQADAAAARTREMRADAAAWLANAMPRLFVFRRAGRVEAWAAHNRYRLDCRANRAVELDRTRFVLALVSTGHVRECWVRISRHGVARGLAGLQYA